VSGSVQQPARAEFATVSGSFVSKRLLHIDSPNGTPIAIGPVAVRGDGSILAGAVDSPLHLLPPSGGELTDANRFGPADLLAFTMVVRKGLLYVLVRDHGQGCPIVVLDPNTGAEVKRLQWSQCQWPIVAVDPTNGQLLLQAFTKSACSPCALDGHGLVELDPDTGQQTTIVRDPIGPYSEAAAFSPDGQWIFIGEEPNAETKARKDPDVYIDVYPKAAAAASAYRIVVPTDNSPDGLVYAGEASCFGDSLVFGDDFGSVFQVPHPSAASTQAMLVATSKQPDTPSFANQSELTLDGAGNVIVNSFDSAMELSCPKEAGPVVTLPPKAAPTPAAPRPTVPAPPPPPKPAPAPSPAKPSVHVAAPTQPATPPQPPPAIPAGPALGPAQAGSQVALSPGAVGLVDVPQQEAVLHMAAADVSRSGLPPWAPLGLGAVALTAMASGAWVLTGRRSEPVLRLEKVGTHG